jgi:hypothetical protein
MTSAALAELRPVGRRRAIFVTCAFTSEARAASASGSFKKSHRYCELTGTQRLAGRGAIGSRSVREAAVSICGQTRVSG